MAIREVTRTVVNSPTAKDQLIAILFEKGGILCKWKIQQPNGRYREVMVKCSGAATQLILARSTFQRVVDDVTTDTHARIIGGINQ